MSDRHYYYSTLHSGIVSRRSQIHVFSLSLPLCRSRWTRTAVVPLRDSADDMEHVTSLAILI